MNVIWTPDAVRTFRTVDVAVAVATDRGLVTPVLRDVTLEIAPPLASDDVAALTVTVPALPLLPGSVSAAIPVPNPGAAFRPLIDSIPDALTETSPLFPAAVVRLAIVAALVMAT